MRVLKLVLLWAFISGLSPALLSQSLDSSWVFSHPENALDTINKMVKSYAVSSLEDRDSRRSSVMSMLEVVKNSGVDSIWVSKAYFQGYRVQDKRDITNYKPLVEAIGKFAPKDSVRLKFYANYMIGNAFIYRETYDSAAYYFNKALDYDENNDIGGYEGAVAERLSIIFYKLADYNRSLEFAELSLVKAKPKLKAAVYNQMANTLVMMEEYEKAIVAYDSASSFYLATENPNWWYPIFNSLTCYLEVKDTTSFKEAYDQIKDVPRLKETGIFYHLLNMAKAEFTLTEWQRSHEGSAPVWGGMVLERTPENESWIRGVLQEQIEYTESEWREHRDALYFLKRWYALCEPDSTKYAYERILNLDQTFRNSPNFNTRSTYLERGETEELQALVARLGYTMLEEQLKQVSEIKQILSKESQNTALFGVLLLLAVLGLWQIRALQNKNGLLLEHGRLLKEKKERILNLLLPTSQRQTMDKRTRVESELHEDCVLVVADIAGFEKHLTKTNADDMLNYLERCFTVLESVCRAHGLESARTDGSSFLAIGGSGSNVVTPSEALGAAVRAKAELERISFKSKTSDNYPTLRIGIHVGDVLTGVPHSRLVGFDYWGDSIVECGHLSRLCSNGKIAMSMEAFNSSPAGSIWPKFERRNEGGSEWIEFQ